MYCSTCGSLIPNGRTECGTCGTAVPGRNLPRVNPSASPAESQAPALSLGVAECPRCAYRGQGLPYFTRGPHMAALIGAALFTLPYALGAGGFIYYGLRRDHKVCPRCGHGWGKFGDQALAATGPSQPRQTRVKAPSNAAESIPRVWSILLLMLGGLTLAVGIAEAELVVFTFGVLAIAGAWLLQRTANRAREERRLTMLADLQTPVLQLAAERRGLLTVTDVAATLGWSIRRAEKILQSLDDGWRVNSEVTDEGVIIYEFRELMHGSSERPPELEDGDPY